MMSSNEKQNIAQKIQNMMAPYATHFGKRHFGSIASLLGPVGVNCLAELIASNVEKTISTEILPAVERICDALKSAKFNEMISNDPYVYDMSEYLAEFEKFFTQTNQTSNVLDLWSALREIGNMIVVFESLQNAVYVTESENGDERKALRRVYSLMKANSSGEQNEQQQNDDADYYSMWFLPKIYDSVANAAKALFPEENTTQKRRFCTAFSILMLTVCHKPMDLVKCGYEPVDARMAFGDSFAIAGAALLCAIDQYSYFSGIDFIHSLVIRTQHEVKQEDQQQTSAQTQSIDRIQLSAELYQSLMRDTAQSISVASWMRNE